MMEGNHEIPAQRCSVFAVSVVYPVTPAGNMPYASIQGVDL
jgi:hypothetical protein